MKIIFSLLFTLLISSTAFSKTNKIDILFVIDNSGSMGHVQQELKNAMSDFIFGLRVSSLDYRIGVTTTDTWAMDRKRLKDGANGNHSGVFVVDQYTLDALEINLSQGIKGNGNEKGLESMKQALESVENSDFRRQDAQLAVIVLSDENDASTDDKDNCLLPVVHYSNFLQYFSENKPFSFSSITVKDQSCLNIAGPTSTIGARYSKLSSMTNGIDGSICDMEKSLDDILSLIRSK